ncbi:hypothetical protein [Actinophytocola gossypii]|uniref:Uncharacterized protein n=1 Tax=Actinophytocola gossypii TaxID=2812003 RepID=A0ABT2JJ76_9PSEU|nr:hypothetical protein [Actinophytocola gossypii]MCT2587930.1 hypothetical protein [Actinophytocola gossypii]
MNGGSNSLREEILLVQSPVTPPLQLPEARSGSVESPGFPQVLLPRRHVIGGGRVMTPLSAEQPSIVEVRTIVDRDWPKQGAGAQLIVSQSVSHHAECPIAVAHREEQR